MQFQEIELKYHFLTQMDFQRLMQFLGQKSVHPVSCREQINYIFDTPSQKLREKKIMLRLRQEDSHWLLTLKAPGEDISSSQTPSALFIRKEYEISLTHELALEFLSNGDQLLSFVARGGLEETPEQEEKRLLMAKILRDAVLDEKLYLLGSFSNIRNIYYIALGDYLQRLELDETHYGRFETRYELEVEIPLVAKHKQVQESIEQILGQCGARVQVSKAKTAIFYERLDPAYANRPKPLL